MQKKEFSVENFFDLTKTDFSKIFEDVEFVWEILPKISSYIEKIQQNLDEDFKEIKPGVFVGKGTTIAETAHIDGPAIIGKNVEIRHSAFIRGKVIIGNNVVIGNSCEIKNSFIFNNAQIPHFNYVGDSILGYKAHIGAGVICSNVKSIKGNVFVKDALGNKIDTNLRKFSAILGDFAEVGCNTVLNPGTIVGKNSVIYPLSNVRGIVLENHIYKNKNEIIKKR